MKKLSYVLAALAMIAVAAPAVAQEGPPPSTVPPLPAASHHEPVRFPSSPPVPSQLPCRFYGSMIVVPRFTNHHV